MNNINVIKSLEDLESSGKIQQMEQLQCKGLIMPFSSSSSGSRKQMFGAELEQKLDLINPELPRVGTGYENAFGDRSSSLITTDKQLLAIYKISKFSFDPNRFYYMIVLDPENNQFDVIERKDYEHITESYGILYDNKYMDSLKEGQKIEKNSTIRKSRSYDEYNNRMDGVNLMCVYMSLESTKEDGYVISQTAAKKLAAPLVRKIAFQINDNDIPLNLYARNSTDYKCFPDIGESTDDASGILCALRRQKKEEMLFTQSRQNLSKVMISDDKYITHGKVVDIDIYCNDNDILADSYYFSQLKFYNDERIRFMQEYVDKVGPLIESHYKCSYDMKRLYTDFKNILSGGQYLKDNVFSNVMIEITIVEESEVKKGDKIANRYGGKGVISCILPDEMMPLANNGRRAEVILNSSTTLGRENTSQLNETITNFFGNKIAEHVYSLPHMDLNYVMNLYIDFLKILDEELGTAMEEYLLQFDPEDQLDFLSNVFKEGIRLSLNPISNTIGIDKFLAIRKRFEFVKELYEVKVPQIGSDGRYRYVTARRKLEMGEQYFWRLKQYAEEKFSVVSLSATNLKNENTRNNSKRSYKTPYAKTSVRFGNMETGDYLHLGPEPVITYLLLVSLSPRARKRVGRELTEGSIFNQSIKLKPGEANRSVEILNAYLTTIGLELVFIKVPKRVKKMLHYPRKDNSVPKLKRHLNGKPAKLNIVNSPLIIDNEEDGCYYIPVTVGEERRKPKLKYHYKEEE